MRIGEKRSVAQPLSFPDIPEKINVNVPVRVGRTLGKNIWDKLTGEEQGNIVEAAKAIYANYRTGMMAVGN